MARDRRVSRRRLDPNCSTCMVSVRHCTCGLHGTPEWPGGTRVVEETASDEAFDFETIEEYRRAADDD